MEQQINKGKASDPSGREQIQQVLDGGYCVGCGACSVASPTSFSVSLHEDGCYRVDLLTAVADHESTDHMAGRICPFSALARNEDDIAAASWPDAPQQVNGVGRFVATYAGYVLEPGYRDRGSSGGMVSWVATELLLRGLVDGVVHVKAGEAPGPLFTYGISRTPEELHRHAKSRYYPVELSRILNEVEASSERYAILVLPCYAKALRGLFRERPSLRDRLPYVIGLFCGHQKSTGYAENYGWQAGIPPSGLRGVDFRVKLPGNTANHYGVKVRGVVDGEERTLTLENEKVFGANWGLGFFKINACDYCDDVTAEVADISIGDAWIEPYINDDRGTNIVVVRDPIFRELLEAGRNAGHLALDVVAGEDVVASQRSGLRHRREGLAYRLHLKQRQGQWAPPKRVAPSDAISRLRKRIYRLRMEVAQKSHQAFLAAKQANDYTLFVRNMTFVVDRYQDCYAVDGWHRSRRVLKRTLRRMLGERVGQRLIGWVKRMRSERRS